MIVSSGSRQILIHGMLLVLVGLIWGLVHASHTPPAPRPGRSYSVRQWGTTQMLSLAANQAGATGGEPWQELVVQLTHILAGLGLILAWLLLVVGFLRKAPGTAAEES